ncbi:hypothetical protein FKM82_017981 [Ascaphus truei]
MPVSLTRLVNFSIWQLNQILFRILGMEGITLSFHTAAISHRVARAKCPINLLFALESPSSGLFSKNSHGSRGIGRPKLL